MVRLAGKVCVNPDCVKSKPLLLVKVMVSVEAAFGATVAGANASVTTGAIGVTVMGEGQALAAVFADEGTLLTHASGREGQRGRVRFPRGIRHGQSQTFPGRCRWS